MTVDAEAEKIRAGVVAHDVDVLLSFVALAEITVGVQDALDVCRQGLDQLLAKGRVDHAETTAGQLGKVEALDVGALGALLADDLCGYHDEASTLHGQHAREGL